MDKALEISVRNPDEKMIRSRAQRLLMRCHTDQVGSDAAAHIVDLLVEIQNHPNQIGYWSSDIRKMYPSDGTITIQLTGLDPHGNVREPLSVPLLNPARFMDMLTVYLDTGSVPEVLMRGGEDIVPPALLDEETAEEQEAAIEEDDGISRLRHRIREATSFDQCFGFKMATRVHGAKELQQRGIFTELDEVAKKLASQEVTAVTSILGLEAISDKVNRYPFTDKMAKEELLAKIEERSKEGLGLNEPSAPKNTFEERAADATSIEEFAQLVAELKEAQMTDKEREYTHRSLDTMAKNMLFETFEQQTSINDLVSLYARARQFPFSEEKYAEDVRTSLETRAKYFILGSIELDHTIKELNTIEESCRKFPFTHENMTDLMNEIVIRREKLRGNDLNVEYVNEKERDRQEINNLTDLGLREEPELELPEE